MRVSFILFHTAICLLITFGAWCWCVEVGRCFLLNVVLRSLTSAHTSPVLRSVVVLTPFSSSTACVLLRTLIVPWRLQRLYFVCLE